MLGKLQLWKYIDCYLSFNKFVVTHFSSAVSLLAHFVLLKFQIHAFQFLLHFPTIFFLFSGFHRPTSTPPPPTPHACSQTTKLSLNVNVVNIFFYLVSKNKLTLNNVLPWFSAGCDTKETENIFLAYQREPGPSLGEGVRLHGLMQVRFFLAMFCDLPPWRTCLSKLQVDFCGWVQSF